MTTTILLVRHGQTEWNRVERFRGQIDIDLNATGFQQAQKTALRIKEGWKPTCVYSSPLQRAIHTANSIALTSNCKVEKIDNLRDINYGEWQGLTSQEVRERWPEKLDNWFSRPEQVEIPGGESLEQVSNRVMSGFYSILKSHTDQSIVVVGHTVVNRLILLGILGLGIDHFWCFQQDPCSINFIEHKETHFLIRSMNDTNHLV